MTNSTGTSFFEMYMPHGHCYLWQPQILAINVISDLLIAVAYFTIPIALTIFVRRRPDIRFRGVFVLFALFITCCGITHLFSIYTIWQGAYGIHGLTKAVTATVSIFTAIALFRLLPQALTIPTPEQYASKVKEVISEKQRRSQLEQQHESDSILRFAVELLPTGLLVIDEAKQIILVNRALERMFGYDRDELIGVPLNELLVQDQRSHHNFLIDSYLKNPEQHYAMAAGRYVRGRAKDGSSVTIEISLSTHNYQAHRYAFASVSDFKSLSMEKTLQQESSNRIRRAIDATSEGIWEWNVATNDVWYSLRLMCLIGRDPKQDRPHLKHWMDHIHPLDLKEVQTALNEHFTQHKRFDVVYRGISESGNYEWFHTRGDTLFDDQGKPLLMSGVLSNINSIKLLEEELAEKSQFLNQILEKSLCGMYIYNIKKQRVTYINPEFTEITGFSQDNIQAIRLNSKNLSIFHPDQRRLVRRHFEQVIENPSRAGVSTQFQFRHKQGNWIWLYSRDSIYAFDNTGFPTEILGTFFEITELKLREQKVKALALDFSTTFEQAAVGIAHISQDGQLLKANNRLCEILGYSHQQLLSKCLSELTHPDDHTSDSQLRAELTCGQRSSYAVEKRVLRNNGELIWINLTVSMAHYDKEEFSHYIYVWENISERKRVEQALAESNASLERFAYSASHDLQEPLRKISAFSDSVQQRLQNKLNEPEAQFELSRISDAANRMRDMIDSLLQLSRYTKNKVEKQKTSLFDVLQPVLEDLSQLITESNAQVNADENVPCWADTNAMQQVLRNLISNSIRYAKNGVDPVITITGNLSTSQLTIKIQDNGQGFDPQYSEQIFEPFRRLVGRDKPGSGMGLALCRQILAAHDGKIKAISQENNGATFIIELPHWDDQNA